MNSENRMFAVRLHAPGGPEALLPEEVPVPQPGPGEALVEIEAAGLNFIEVYQHAGSTRPRACDRHRRHGRESGARARRRRGRRHRVHAAWRAGELFAWIEAGQLDVRIGQEFALADVAKAHRALEARQTTGKVILRVAGSV